MKAPALPDVPMIPVRQAYLAIAIVAAAWLIDVLVKQEQMRRACAGAFNSGLQMGLTAERIEVKPVPKRRKGRREPGT